MTSHENEIPLEEELYHGYKFLFARKLLNIILSINMGSIAYNEYGCILMDKNYKSINLCYQLPKELVKNHYESFAAYWEPPEKYRNIVQNKDPELRKEFVKVFLYNARLSIESKNIQINHIIRDRLFFYLIHKDQHATSNESPSEECNVEVTIAPLNLKPYMIPETLTHSNSMDEDSISDDEDSISSNDEEPFGLDIIAEEEVVDKLPKQFTEWDSGPFNGYICWDGKNRTFKKYIFSTKLDFNYIPRYSEEWEPREIPIDIWINIILFFPLSDSSDMKLFSPIPMVCRSVREACKAIKMTISGNSDSIHMIKWKCNLFNVNELKNTSCDQAETVASCELSHCIKSISWWSIGLVEIMKYYKIISEFQELEHIGPCFNRLNLYKSDNTFITSEVQLPSVKSIFMSFSHNKYAYAAIQFWTDLLKSSRSTLQSIRMHYPPTDIWEQLQHTTTLESVFLIPSNNELSKNVVDMILSMKRLKRLTLKSCDKKAEFNKLISKLNVLTELESFDISGISSMNFLSHNPIDLPNLKHLGLYRVYVPPPPQITSLSLNVPRNWETGMLTYFDTLHSLETLTIWLETRSNQVIFSELMNTIVSRRPNLRTLNIIQEVFNLTKWSEMAPHVRDVSIQSETNETIYIETLFFLLHMLPNATLHINPMYIGFFEMKSTLEKYEFMTQEMINSFEAAMQFLLSITNLPLNQQLQELYTRASTEHFSKPVCTICEVVLFSYGAIKRPQFFNHIKYFTGLPDVILI